MSNHLMFWRSAGLKDRAHDSDTSHPFGIDARLPSSEPSLEERAAFWRCLHRRRRSFLPRPQRFARPRPPLR